MNVSITFYFNIEMSGSEYNRTYTLQHIHMDSDCKTGIHAQ